MPMNTPKTAPANGANPQQPKYPIPADFARIAAAALVSVESVLTRWLPNG